MGGRQDENGTFGTYCHGRSQRVPLWVVAASTEGGGKAAVAAAGSIPRWARPSLEFWLAAVLVALNLVDLLVTREVISRGGTEVNPLVAPFIDGLGATLAKTAGVGVIALSLLRKAPASRRTLVGALVLYTGVVAWNTAILITRY